MNQPLSQRKSTHVAMTFVALCLVAAIAPSPDGDGRLLDLVPSPPPALDRSVPVDLPSTREAAPVVDLSALGDAPSRSSTRGAADRSAALPSATSGTATAAGSANGEASDEASPSSDRAAAALTGTNATPTPDDLHGAAVAAAVADRRRLAEPIRALVQSLGPDPGWLHNPCVVDSTDGCVRRALDRFMERLAAVALRQADAPVRISQYGDSLVVGDQYTGELRRLLQRQFGDGGHGFVYPGNPLRTFGYEDIRLGVTDGWRVRSIVRSDGSAGDLFGMGGVEFRVGDNATFFVQGARSEPGMTLERIGLLYLADAAATGEVTLRVSVDGETEDVALAAEGGDAVHWIELEPGPRRVFLTRFDGRLRYYGVLVERSGPGVVVDNVGQVSARAQHLQKINAEQWARQLALRGTDLVAMFYGVNDTSTTAERFQPGEYAEMYAGVIDNATEAGGARDCLVMSVLTRGVRDGGRLRVAAATPLIREAQRQAAERAGCAFFDTYAMAGGERSVEAWTRARPSLLGADLAHPTPAGYRELARVVHASLMHELLRWLERAEDEMARGVAARAARAGDGADAGARAGGDP